MIEIDWSHSNRHIVDGYIQLRKTIKGKKYSILEHILVWTNANGDVPAGFNIHHINKIRSDNRIDNLQLLKEVYHHRLHSGRFKTVNGIEFKLCKVCNEYKNLSSDYHNSKSCKAMQNICKTCDREKSIAYKNAQMENNREEFKERTKEINRQYYLRKKNDPEYLARKKATRERYLEKKKRNESLAQ
jgi:hypothetical protein